MSFKVGSLFDGSGGFPLVAEIIGGTPIWASEIEPYPIAVTKSRFPQVKHHGSITDVKGNEVAPVDVITFGSPCQDLSVAGKRAGLKHEDNGDEETTRSGLFMEAVRIIKEMREATNGEYPRFAVWENVPGAFSSNKGEDFKIVLEELIKIVEPTAVMPDVPQKGWAYADCYRGDGWSIAYRVFDAQYWGVPQRRRRIYLVADFRGERAGEILFKREGLRGYSSQSRETGKAATGNVEGGTGTADGENGCVALSNVASTLRAGAGAPKHEQDIVGRLVMEPKCYGISSFSSNAMLSDNPHSGIYEAETSRTLDLNGGNPACNQGGIAVVEPIPYTLKIRSGCEGGGKGALVQEDMSATLATNNDQYLFQPVVYESHPMDCRIKELKDGVCPTVSAKWHKGAADTPLVCESNVYSIENHPADSRVNIDDSGKVQTLTGRMGTGGGNVPMVLEEHPTYCLQGNGIDRADNNGCAGKGECYTLDRHGVAYSIGNGQLNQISMSETCNTLDCMHDKQAVIYRQGGFADYIEGEAGTIRASGGDLGGGSENLVVSYPQYIVRRLTPTECARLQGFPDYWGYPDKKDDFTDEEYAFWLNVRNTHAEINGKQVKDYTKPQMLTWYNKLHTDSSEYKMWGNGIALPNALYVMQGIGEVYT